MNARAVRDRVLANAVRLGYRDVLYHGRHPSYLLYLTLDPRQVDVNAHPTKLELRFRDSRAVHDGVFRSVERALAATSPSAALAASAGDGAATIAPVDAALQFDAPVGWGGAAGIRAAGRATRVRATRAAALQPRGRWQPRSRQTTSSRSASRSRSCTVCTSWRRAATA